MTFIIFDIRQKYCWHVEKPKARLRRVKLFICKTYKILQFFSEKNTKLIIFRANRILILDLKFFVHLVQMYFRQCRRKILCKKRPSYFLSRRSHPPYLRRIRKMPTPPVRMYENHKIKSKFYLYECLENWVESSIHVFNPDKECIFSKQNFGK